MHLKTIDEQVVVVMGASSGIGRETALRFAAKGAKVVISARNEDGLTALALEIRDKGGEATAIPADVTDFRQVKAVADGAIEVYGRIDTWVHAAAVSLYARFDETTPEEFRRIIDVNLLGQAYGAMAALPHLKREGRGALIHISSVEGKRAMPLQSAYAASKHGIIGFLDALRLELMHDRIPVSVTNIMPAAINTPLFNKAKTKLGVKPKGVPPFYQPSAVAESILYAAEHPVRDMVVGGAGRLFVLGQALSPKLMDRMLKDTGFRSQRTHEPKSESAPNSLFEPIDGYNRVEGDFGEQAKPVSLYNWIRTHSAARLALAGVAIRATLLWRQQQEKPSLEYTSTEGF